MICICLGVLAGLMAATPAQSEETAAMQQVLERYRRILLQDRLPDTEEAAKHAAALGEDGTWPDLDYRDASRSGWHPGKHMGRVRAMALVSASGGVEPAAAADLAGAVDRALDHWLEKRYQAPNWWWNQIGVPRAMRDIVVLLGDRLSGPRRLAAIEVIGQHEVRGTGANLVWSTELAMHQACLQGDAASVARAAQRIWEEIEVGDAEGIQKDWSFYQHGARLQAFHYGRAYVDVVCKTAWQLQPTPWRIPAAKRDVVSNYILEGLQWMCRGVHTVPGTMDRQVSRQGSLRAADLRRLLPLWAEVHPARRAEVEVFLARQDGRGSPLVGYRHFPDADFTAFHHPAASIFLKLVSSRTLLSESINSENLKGVPYLGCGDHYVVSDGAEYGDLQPVWDWRRLPGLTLPDAPTEQQRQPYVGGLGDGRSGLTAMDHVRTGKDSELAVRKMWAFHGDAAVCLIGGWRTDGPVGAAATSVEQRRLRGPVRLAAGGEALSLDAPDGTSREAAWVLHDGVGYLPLGGGRLRVRVERASGSWHAINDQYENETVRESVVSIWLEHAKEPAAGGFAIVLDVDADRLAKLAERPAWRVLRNDRDVQHIRFDDSLEMAAFYAAGSASADGGDAGLRVDRPCLAMWSDESLWLCDPTHAGGRVRIATPGDSREVDLPVGGRTVRIAGGRGGVSGGLTP